MARLSEEEQAQLEALRAKEEAPDEQPEGAGFGSGVIVLQGEHAETFITRFLGGSGSSSAPAKKAAAPAKKAAAPAKRAAPAAGAEPEGDGDPEGDGEGAPASTEGDAEPPRTNRYFR